MKNIFELKIIFKEQEDCEKFDKLIKQIIEKNEEELKMTGWVTQVKREE
jgi:hypothetical protein